ncbi:Rdi1p [Ascoidea rubescens DSM 1968]|uniref:E set domain-containing protein n=1 Tax=Ascoidea rubescens DSM 1968 TaxID=1344418 RepID=A0A1D2VCI3_9ASCO|nr:E set domain-containing protein [Ascoidea rubescens DSM 1968]ODV59193.1 E set domain-containing protein [Ascoidea rubescens DSM 1968]
MPSNTDDLVPEDAPGYYVTEKKTLEEYNKLDAEDESLVKWKKSLGLDTSALLPVNPNDNRKVVILEMALLVDGKEPVVVDLSDESVLKTLSKNPFKVEEKSIYRLKIKFKIQHEIVTGIKYLQGIRKAGITLDKLEEPLGSYAPNTVNKPYYEVTLPEMEAPSGMLARGTYGAVSKFVDDDKQVHLLLNWAVEIVKVGRA